MDISHCYAFLSNCHIYHYLLPFSPTATSFAPLFPQGKTFIFFHKQYRRIQSAWTFVSFLRNWCSTSPGMHHENGFFGSRLSFCLQSFLWGQSNICNVCGSQKSNQLTLIWNFIHRVFISQRFYCLILYMENLKLKELLICPRSES